MIGISSETSIPRVAVAFAPTNTTIVRVERMSRAFTKYHIDPGRPLHRFRMNEPHANPHDHSWSFETEILAGAYVEEVFHLLTGGGWRSELVYRNTGAVHQVPAEHVHRIVDLPRRECLDRGASRCKRAGNAVLAVQR